MAVAGYTSDDLLARIKARGQVPAADDRLSDADIFEIADDVNRSTIGRLVYDADDGRTVRTQADVSITTSVSDYRLPDRAVGGGLYDVLTVDSAGNEWSSPYIDSADAWRFRNDAWGEGSPRRYRHTIEGDTLRLLPTPTATQDSLRLKYRRRPSKLVAVSSGGLITAATSTTITVSSVPSAWTSSETVDVIRGGPGGDSIEDSVACTISGSVLTRSSGTWDTTGAYVPAAGDYVCLEGVTCVVPVPEEAVPLLTVMATLEVVIALGDEAAAATLERLVTVRRRELVALIADRSREDVAIVPRYSHLRSVSRAPWES